MDCTAPNDFDAGTEFDIPALFAQMKSRQTETPTEASLRELAEKDFRIKRIREQYLIRKLKDEAPEALAQWLVTEMTKRNTHEQ